jgi:hypothetical protein
MDGVSVVRLGVDPKTEPATRILIAANGSRALHLDIAPNREIPDGIFDPGKVKVQIVALGHFPAVIVELEEFALGGGQVATVHIALYSRQRVFHRLRGGKVGRRCRARRGSRTFCCCRRCRDWGRGGGCGGRACVTGEGSRDQNKNCQPYRAVRSFTHDILLFGFRGIRFPR